MKYLLIIILTICDLLMFTLLYLPNEVPTSTHKKIFWIFNILFLIAIFIGVFINWNFHSIKTIDILLIDKGRFVNKVWFIRRFTEMFDILGHFVNLLILDRADKNIGKPKKVVFYLLLFILVNIFWFFLIWVMDGAPKLW